MRRMITAALATILCGASTSVATDRVVGVNAPGGGATLSKRIQVVAGAEFEAVEFVSNEQTTGFPAVRLRQYIEGRAGEVLWEALQVGPGSEARHRRIVPLPRLSFVETEEILVEVVLPATTGAARAGVGVGLGANPLEDALSTSYIGSTSSADLQGIDADLSISLVESAPAGKAMAPETGPGASSAPHPQAELRSQAGGDLEIRISNVDAHLVAIDIYDVKGAHLRALSVPQAAAPRTAVWDRRSADGRRVASGVYFIVVRVGNQEVVRKSVLLR